MIYLEFVVHLKAYHKVWGFIPPLENITTEVSNKRKRARRGKPNTNMWKQNLRKRNRQLGKEYVSVAGKNVKARTCIYKNCKLCPRKCNQHFSKEECELLFNSFWDIGDIHNQRQYISSLIKVVEIERTRCKTLSRRQSTMKYYLIKNNIEIQVCGEFFRKTFNVSETFLRTVIGKKDSTNFIAKDKRGCQTPTTKRPDSSKEAGMAHISSFPRVPSHYCRKDTDKEYLAADLNLGIMYELYKSQCENNNTIAEKSWFYRNVFNTEFNICFHKPRKDQCDTCFKFQNYNESEKSLHQEEHNIHIERKNLARQIKNDLKEEAKLGNCHLLEFDLEAVRCCPKSGSKAIFYKRRLAVYNLTIYNVSTLRAINYMWHESIAKRGSIEIASCMYLHLQNIANNKPVFMFSNTCGGQNRNVNFCAMLLYAVHKFDIPVITQHFFEPGHSVMECDSVHAHIENAAKNVNIYDPSGWYTVVQLASKKRCYEVKEMNQGDFVDFVDLRKHIIKNKKIDDEKNNINWLRVVCFQYRKSEPNKVFFKYNNNDEYKSFSITRHTRQINNIINFHLKLAYKNGPLPLDPAKVKDLKNLCESGIIPEQYQQFYFNLFDCSSDNPEVDSDED